MNLKMTLSKSFWVMSTKGFVLYPFLIIFLSLIISINNTVINEFGKKREYKQAVEIDQFSLVEIQTIRLIKQQFLSFKPKSFSVNLGNWDVKVTFIEETAHITYSGKEIIVKALDYDMVFENVLNYRQINRFKSDIH
jgi:hypothetical protein